MTKVISRHVLAVLVIVQYATTAVVVIGILAGLALLFASMVICLTSLPQNAATAGTFGGLVLLITCYLLVRTTRRPRINPKKEVS